MTSPSADSAAADPVQDTGETAPAPDSYGRILKTSALLGGSSVVNVILGIIRTKVLALQLGPALFGVMGLYTTLTAMISSVTSLGIGQSAVRDIAAAAGSGDELRMARTTLVFRRIVWITGLFGLLVTVALAYPASGWTFGNHHHVWAIALLSLTVLFAEFTAGQTALLQGLRRIRDLSAMNVLGAILSTVLSIPLLLRFRERGIIPFLLAVAAGQLAISWWYARRVKVVPVKVTWRETYEQSREMTSLGVAFVVSALAVSGSTYLIRLLIRRFAGEAGVGLYQSAFAICSIYVGFVLQAMAGDYYPRLSAVANDAPKRNQLVNEQAEMAVLLATPGLVAALVFSDLLIWLLYSNRFAGASDILRWQVLGLLGRIISWPLGFILLARGDKAAFLWSEIAASLLHVALVGAGVAWFGTAGAGAAFAGLYLVYVGLVLWIVRARHEYAWRSSTRNLVMLGTVLVLVAFGSTFCGSRAWRFGLGSAILAIAGYASVRGMVQRLGMERLASAWRSIVVRIGFAGA